MVKDWPESVANSWLDFERDKGTIEQIEFCECKIKEKLEKVTEERLKAHQQTNLQNELFVQSKKMNKRKADDGGKWKNIGSTPLKIMKTDEKDKLELQRSRINSDNEMRDDSEQIGPVVVQPPPGFKTFRNEKTIDKSREIDDKSTVFISNLDYTATEDEVRNALKPAGPIISFKMIRDYKGRSKGYCYVQLSSAVC